MSIETISQLRPTGDLASNTPLMDKDLLKSIYKTMVQVRNLDPRMVTLQRQGIISFAMSSRGEEGCAAASAAALEPCDWLYFQYREQAAILQRGMSLTNYVHHMFGNKFDCCKGRQMCNHFGDKELNAVTVSSTLATQLPNAAGCAYGMKLNKEKAVTIAYFGEGAASEGDFHAAMNFAATRSVPCIFFCRNNQWAISTPSSKQYAGDGIAARGPGYGMKTYRIDGNDVFAVYNTVREARQYCIEGNGPVLIEAMTCRMEAHSTADDPTCYRCKEDLCQWNDKCPIRRLRLYLMKQDILTDTENEKILEEVKQEIEEAIQSAKAAPNPPLQWMFEDIYKDKTWNLKEQEEEVRKLYGEVSHD